MTAASCAGGTQSWAAASLARYSCSRPASSERWPVQSIAAVLAILVRSPIGRDVAFAHLRRRALRQRRGRMFCWDPAFPLLPDPRSVSIARSASSPLLPEFLEPGCLGCERFLGSLLGLGRTRLMCSFLTRPLRLRLRRRSCRSAQEPVEQALADLCYGAEGSQPNESGRVQRIANPVPFLVPAFP